MTRVLITFLLSVMVVGCGQAVTSPTVSGPVVAAPSYQVGDTWTLSNGVVATVRETRDDGVVIFTGGLGYIGGRRISWKDGVVEVIGVTERQMARGTVLVGPGWQFWNFPLEVGKTWETSGKGFIGGRVHQITVVCKIWSYEDVQTKAGTFKAFRTTIEWHGNSAGYLFRNTHTVWYAPAVKFVVKEHGPPGLNIDRELVSFSVR